MRVFVYFTALSDLVTAIQNLSHSLGDSVVLGFATAHLANIEPGQGNISKGQGQGNTSKGQDNICKSQGQSNIRKGQGNISKYQDRGNTSKGQSQGNISKVLQNITLGIC